jgi:hypothetical protein
MSARANTPSIERVHITHSSNMSPVVTYAAVTAPNAPVKARRRRMNFDDIDDTSGDDTNLFSRDIVTSNLFGEVSTTGNGGSATSHTGSSNISTSYGATDQTRKRTAESSADETTAKISRNDGWERLLSSTQNASVGHVTNNKPRGDNIVAANIVIKEQKGTIADLDTEIKNLNNTIEGLKNTVKYQDMDLQQEETRHYNDMASIRKSVDNLRYVYEFGMSKSRGQMTCPVSLQLLHPSSSVLVLRAACNCNCMVKYEFAEPILRKFYGGEVVRCFTCNTEIEDIIATTTENAEKLFAWRDVEEKTYCDTLEELHDMRTDHIANERSEQKTLDTLQLRQQMQAALDGNERH